MRRRRSLEGFVPIAGIGRLRVEVTRLGTGGVAEVAAGLLAHCQAQGACEIFLGLTCWQVAEHFHQS
jgi:hypothetical protein